MQHDRVVGKTELFRTAGQADTELGEPVGPVDTRPITLFEMQQGRGAQRQGRQVLAQLPGVLWAAYREHLFVEDPPARIARPLTATERDGQIDAVGVQVRVGVGVGSDASNFDLGIRLLEAGHSWHQPPRRRGR